LADRTSFFRFGREPRGFDILPDIPGVDFDAAWARRVETVIDPTSGLKANFISADDLVAAKLAAGRPQDIADVDAIRKSDGKPAVPSRKKDPGSGRPQKLKPGWRVGHGRISVHFESQESW
jgi:hypothetical protein